MKDFVFKILTNNLVEAKNKLNERINELVQEKLTQIKLRVANELAEGNIMKMGRLKVVRVRIRNGKVQRRKKLSAVKGYTTRNGRLVRMSPMERRNRKLSARRSRFKRRAKLRQSLRKRKMSLRRRGAMGLN
jgi:hypothetical protein